jgi:hypothetical protein
MSHTLGNSNKICSLIHICILVPTEKQFTVYKFSCLSLQLTRFNHVTSSHCYSRQCNQYGQGLVKSCFWYFSIQNDQYSQGLAMYCGHATSAYNAVTIFRYSSHSIQSLAAFVLNSNPDFPFNYLSFTVLPTKWQLFSGPWDNTIHSSANKSGCATFRVLSPHLCHCNCEICPFYRKVADYNTLIDNSLVLNRKKLYRLQAFLSMFQLKTLMLKVIDL